MFKLDFYRSGYIGVSFNWICNISRRIKADKHKLHVFALLLLIKQNRVKYNGI